MTLSTRNRTLITLMLGWLALIILMFIMALLTTPKADAGTPPACYPKIQYPPQIAWGSAPAGTSPDGDHFATWACETPTGYTTEAFLFTWSSVADGVLQYVAGLWSQAQAATDCTTECDETLSASELAYLQQIAVQARPVAVVAFNNASPTRSVYTTNADGTLTTTPLVGVTVTVLGPWQVVPC